MNFIKEKLTEDSVKKITAILLLVMLLFALSPFKNLLLLTFIFTFIFSKMQNSIHDITKKKLGVNLNKKLITILLFFITIGLIVLSLLIYIPKLSTELMQMKDNLFNIIVSSDNPLIQKYSEYVLKWDYISYFKENSDATFKTLSSVQQGAVTFFLSLILTLFFLLEEKSIKELGEKMKTSKLHFLYNYYIILGKKFLNSFGKVIQVQLIIAIINSLLSVVGLMVLGFPEPIALGFMIFIFSLIPVLGVTISLIPLSLIAFKIGGIYKIIEILILIVVLHSLEAYAISPKLMSEKSHLPIPITFLTLIIGEHLFGIWGLLITIPLLMFFMELLDVK